MRRALHREINGVVGVTDVRHFLVAAGDRVGAGREHGVDRIPAITEQTGLRAVAVERNAERKDLADADQAGGADDVFGLDVIERADLVVFAPTSPVLELFGRLRDRFLADGDIHPDVSFHAYLPGLSCQISKGGARQAMPVAHPNKQNLGKEKARWRVRAPERKRLRFRAGELRA